MVVVVRFVLFFFILCLAVLGVHSQRTDHAPAKQATCEELTHAISVNQLSLLKIMGQGSYASIGLAERETRQEEAAAARDASLQELVKVVQDLGNANQETLNAVKGLAERETRQEDAAAARDASHQELVKVVQDLGNANQETLNAVKDSRLEEALSQIRGLEAEHQRLRDEISNAKEEALGGVASLREDMTRKVTALQQELATKVASLQDEISAQGRFLKEFHRDACPDGWLSHGLSCYLVDGTGRTWEDSREYCRGLGGDLAKITSAEEQEFIKAQLSGNTWIGLNDRATENHFVWTDGSAATYTAWGLGDPDGTANYDCVYMQSYFDYMWSDVTCTTTLRVVCERPVGA